MLRKTVNPFHSAIRPEHRSEAAAQDLKAAQLNLTTYGNLLTALGLSSTGHPNPSANAFVGALLDTNAANNFGGNQSNILPGLPGSKAVPSFPKVAYHALFHRAHEAIMADPLGVIISTIDSYPWAMNAIFDVLSSDQYFHYNCWVDVSTGSCSSNAIYAWAVLEGGNYLLGADFSNFPSSYAIRYTNSNSLRMSLMQVWSFVLWHQSDIDDRVVVVPEPYTGGQFLNRGISTCFPTLIYAAARDSNQGNYCGNCQY